MTGTSAVWLGSRLPRLATTLPLVMFDPASHVCARGRRADSVEEEREDGPRSRVSGQPTPHFAPIARHVLGPEHPLALQVPGGASKQTSATAMRWFPARGDGDLLPTGES